MTESGSFLSSSSSARWSRRSVSGLGLLFILITCLGLGLIYYFRRAQEEPMQQLKWLNEYSGQTADQLLSLEGTFRIDSLVSAFEQAMDQKAARVGMEALTDEERIILAVEALEREVNNGGYNLFFVNSSREYVPLIVESLRRIGCPRTAEITQKALDALHIPHLTAEEIQEVMAKESKERDRALNLCDRLYFERPEKIQECLFAFIKANKRKIHP